MVDRIKKLCALRGTNLSQVERALDFANGSLAKTSEKTEIGRFVKLAKYFNVSIEYFVDDTGGETATLSQDELKLIRGYRSAIYPIRKAMLGMAEDAIKGDSDRLSNSESEVTA